MSATPSKHALVYVDDSLPGISRRKLKLGWAYHDAAGERITDRNEIDRLNAVGMPPAYTDCWFCPSPHGHIQATGYDDKGRKQYRYHPDFRAQREAEKYDLCAAFGRALPLLRARIEQDLATSGIGYERAVAAVVRLLDVARIRVGNEAYAKANKSFGATTLRMRHVNLDGRKLRLRYRAKSGKLRDVTITDRALLKFVRVMQDLPGQHLFQYLEEDGSVRPVTSTDVNDYIREATGGDFTAKHFRTWGASVLAFQHLLDRDGAPNVKAMCAPVAEALGNTPAISRKSYIHPSLIELCKAAGEIKAWRKRIVLPRRTKYLSREERGLIAFLEALADEATPALREAA